MKKTFFLALLCCFSLIQAQQKSFCNFEAKSSVQKVSHKDKNSNPDDTFCVKIYVHKMVWTSGNGEGNAQINAAITNMQDLFNPQGIFFEWDEQIINTSVSQMVYNTAFLFDYEPFLNDDGIDIFIFPQTNTSPGGKAFRNADGDFSGLYIAGTSIAEPFNSIISTNLLSHEMGHVLDLLHTYHREDPADPQTWELPDGSNCTSAGDGLCDTPADSWATWTNITSNDFCEWNGEFVYDLPPGVSIDDYDPSLRNIMSGFNPECINEFTQGQFDRMRDALASQDGLQNFLISCNVSNCDSCENVTDTILSSIASVDPCGVYQLEIPDGVLNCYNVLFNSGDTGGSLVPITEASLTNGIYAFEYSANGTYNPTVILTDITTGDTCNVGHAEDIIVNCFTEICEDCENLGDFIIDSIEVTDTIGIDPCGFYQLEIPDGTLDCYNVFFGDGIPGNLPVQITESSLINGIYLFNYVTDGGFSADITLFDIATGEKCYFNKELLQINCTEPTCPDCPSLAQEIFDSYDNITNCAGQITIPEGSNDCYDIFIENHQTGETAQLPDGIFSEPIIYTHGDYTIIINENGQNMAICKVEEMFQGAICRNPTDNNNNNKKNIKVYPNPFLDQFTIKDATEIGIQKVEIFNIYGNRIKNQTYISGEQITIDKGPSGLYFAKVYLKDGTVEIVHIIKK